MTTPSALVAGATCAEPATRPPLLEARSLGVTFGGGLWAPKATVALDDVSLAFDGGTPSFVAVVGRSGSGKTTLARALLGLIRGRGGVFFRGRSLASLDGAGRVEFRRTVQGVFQDPFAACNPFYTLDHVLSVPLRTLGIAASPAEALDRMRDALSAVGLDPASTLGRRAHELSAGQLQRVTIARVLAIGPRLVVADEPVSMIDASLRSSILGTLDELRRSHGMSLVYVTHDLATARAFSDRIVVLDGGRVVEAGATEEVIAAPRHPATRELIDAARARGR